MASDKFTLRLPIQMRRLLGTIAEESAAARAAIFLGLLDAGYDVSDFAQLLWRELGSLPPDSLLYRRLVNCLLAMGPSVAVESEKAFTQAEWEALCTSYGRQCLACGATEPLTADHVVPRSKGGSLDISNIQPLCRSCNSAKGDREIDYRPERSAA